MPEIMADGTLKGCRCCRYANHWQTIIMVCENPNSDHNGHMLHYLHLCPNFEEKVWQL